MQATPLNSADFGHCWPTGSRVGSFGIDQFDECIFMDAPEFIPVGSTLVFGPDVVSRVICREYL